MREKVLSILPTQITGAIDTVGLWYKVRLDASEETPTSPNLFAFMNRIRRNWCKRLHIDELDDMIDTEGNSVVVKFSRRKHIIGYSHHGQYIEESVGRSICTVIEVDQPIPNTAITFRTKFELDNHYLSQEQMHCKVSVINSSSKEPITSHHKTIFLHKTPKGLSDSWFQESGYNRLNLTEDQLQTVTFRAFQIAFNQLGRRVPVETTTQMLPMPSIQVNQ